MDEDRNTVTRPGELSMRRGPLRDGESVVLRDRKAREYLRTLRTGETISIRGGKILVADVVGRECGTFVRSSMNEDFLVLRPTLSQLVPNLPRKAQVIYPKDIAQILLLCDLFPGATIIEAGVGAGALTLALLRAMGRDGTIVSYELREDFARTAQKNIATYYGAAPQWTLHVGDVAEGLKEYRGDRIVLDLPEPWHHVAAVWQALNAGGIFLSYLPTVIQVKTLTDTLQSHGGFACIEISETLQRFWHVKEMSMRPQHRMVAHTGFITVARRIAGNREGESHRPLSLPTAGVPPRARPRP